MDRLRFLKIMGASMAGALLAPELLAAGDSPRRLAELKLGNKGLAPDTPRQVSVLVLGAGQRGSAYASYAAMYPDAMKIVGVADINPVRLAKMADEHGVDEKYRFSDWSEALAAGKIADAVVLSLPDDLHYEPCMKALDMGYHILLEKPVAPTRRECEDIRDRANERGAIVAVCHVLRYAPYFVALKQVIDSGMIGQLMSIQHLEPIRYEHMAHSYVRGNWHNSKKTTPIILAKSCHDLDIIRWLVGSPCHSISAYGSLSYFTHANRPAGAPPRCTDGCPHEGTCPYSAIDIYTRKHQHTYVFDNLPERGPERDRAIMEQLRVTDYGRCVFDMDNDQCDHYVAAMEFDNGVTASFSMEAFTLKGGRRTRVMGTLGMIEGDMESFTVSDFRTRESETWSPKDVVEVAAYAGHGHGGGDLCLTRDFINAVGNNDPGRLTSSIDVSTESHVMGFCAEESRLGGKKVSVS